MSSPFLGIYLIWTVAFIVLLMLGFALNTFAGRRIDDHPVCRTCEYDLFNAPTTQTSCPECGTLLDPGATKIGNTKRRVGMTVTGRLLISCAVIATGFVAIQAYNHVVWSHYLPNWYFWHQARESNAWAAFGMVQLTSREDTLNEEERNELAELITETQQTESRGYHSMNLDWVVRATLDGQIDRRHLQKLFEGICANPSLAFDASRTPAKPLYVSVSFPQTKRPLHGVIPSILHRHDTVILLDGVSIQPNEWHSSEHLRLDSIQGVSTWLWIDPSAFRELADGEHKLAVSTIVRVRSPKTDEPIFEQSIRAEGAFRLNPIASSQPAAQSSVESQPAK